jgi:hypothetical protein
LLSIHHHAFVSDLRGREKGWREGGKKEGMERQRENVNGKWQADNHAFNQK